MKKENNYGLPIFEMEIEEFFYDEEKGKMTLYVYGDEILKVEEYNGLKDSVSFCGIVHRTENGDIDVNKTLDNLYDPFYPKNLSPSGFDNPNNRGFNWVAIHECRKVIRECLQKTDKINYIKGSYGLKHILENIISYDTKYGKKSYVSNGEAIIAMIAEGFEYEQNGINAHFNINTGGIHHIQSLRKDIDQKKVIQDAFMTGWFKKAVCIADIDDFKKGQMYRYKPGRKTILGSIYEKRPNYKNFETIEELMKYFRIIS